MGSDARRTRSSLDEWQPVVAIGSTHYVQIDRGDVVSFRRGPSDFKATD